MTTAEQIAEVVRVDVADVRVVLAWIDDTASEDDLPKDVVTALHTYLNPSCERTVPELYHPDISPYWRTED